jgi:hypothetical protein
LDDKVHVVEREIQAQPVQPDALDPLDLLDVLEIWQQQELQVQLESVPLEEQDFKDLLLEQVLEVYKDLQDLQDSRVRLDPLDIRVLLDQLD